MFGRRSFIRSLFAAPLALFAKGQATASACPDREGYGRVAFTNNTDNWPRADWGTIVGRAYWDAPTGGKLLKFYPILTYRLSRAPRPSRRTSLLTGIGSLAGQVRIH